MNPVTPPSSVSILAQNPLPKPVQQSRVPEPEEDWNVREYFTIMKAASVFEDVPFEHVFNFFFGSRVGEPTAEQDLPERANEKAVAKGAAVGFGGAIATTIAGAIVLAPIALPGALSFGLIYIGVFGTVLWSARGMSTTWNEQEDMFKGIVAMKQAALGPRYQKVLSVFNKLWRGEDDSLGSHLVRIAVKTPCDHTFELWDIDQVIKTDNERQFNEFRDNDRNYVRGITKVTAEFRAAPTPCPVCPRKFLATQLRIDTKYYKIMYDLYVQKKAQRCTEESSSNPQLRKQKETRVRLADLEREMEAKQNACVIA